MDNTKKKQSLLWLVIVIAVVAVAAAVVGALYFFNQEPEETVGCEDTAEQFIKAYVTADSITRFDLTFYDARTKWETNVLEEYETEEAFCAEVQQQADEKGIDVDINSFDDYLNSYHQQDLINKEEAYGEYTLTVQATATEKMAADETPGYLGTVMGTVGDTYFEEGSVNTIEEVYTVTVNVSIDGTIKDLNEHYLVYLVQYKGEWLVLSHST